MPPVTLLSPYSGRPVVVREQDLGRAIRDEQGRVFYVVEDPEHGRYASMTRKGSAKDLDRYRLLQSGQAPAMNGAAGSASGLSQSLPAHDATGIKRRNPVGIAVLIALSLLVVASIYVVFAHPEWLGLESKGNPPANQPDTTEPTTQPQSRQNNNSNATRKPSIVVPAVFVSSDPDDIEQIGFDLQEFLQEQHPDSSSPSDSRQQPAPSPEQPQISSEPARLPESTQDYIEQLLENYDDSAALREDPTPVIVPTQTWRPDDQPRVLAEHENVPDKPYADFNHAASGLRFKVTHRTDGPPARAGCYLQIRYTATALDGKVLIEDASQAFVLATGQAIRAFDEGLAGVNEGEQLRLMVPRGHSADGVLPGIKRVPDEPFLLDIQLLAVKPGVTHIVEQPGDADAQPAMPGDTLAIHYIAQVEGKDEVIDATVHTGKPLQLTLGKHEVIPGLELGLMGMRPGESRLLTIPPYLAYGEEGAAGGLIPANAVLTFRVSLVNIQRPDDSQDPQSN